MLRLSFSSLVFILSVSRFLSLAVHVIVIVAAVAVLSAAVAVYVSLGLCQTGCNMLIMLGN